MLLASIEPYAAIGVTILFVMIVCAVQLIVAHAIHPKKIHHGPTKDSPYESGMPIAADTQRRFNVKFYIVAILFLLFDVEIVFMWPWAQAFYQAATTGQEFAVDGGMVGKEFLLGGMAIFFGLLVFGLFYEWKRGAFQWD